MNITRTSGQIKPRERKCGNNRPDRVATCYIILHGPTEDTISSQMTSYSSLTDCLFGPLPLSLPPAIACDIAFPVVWSVFSWISLVVCWMHRCIIVCSYWCHPQMSILWSWSKTEGSIHQLVVLGVWQMCCISKVPRLPRYVLSFVLHPSRSLLTKGQ